MGLGFLERWLVSQTRQHFRGIWTMPLTTNSSFWSALNWSGVELDDDCSSLPTETVCSINDDFPI